MLPPVARQEAVLEYARELVSRGFKIWAAKGRCRTETEVKHAEEIIARDADEVLRLIAERETLAFAVPAQENKLVVLKLTPRALEILAELSRQKRLTLDLDTLKRIREEARSRLLCEIVEDALGFLTWLGFDTAYIQLSPVPEVYIVLYDDLDVYDRIPSIRGYVEKHSYFIAYPSLIYVEDVGLYLPYDKATLTELWWRDTICVSKHIRALERLVNIFNPDLVLEASTASARHEYARVPDAVAEVAARLDLERAVRYFYMVCVIAGCRCVKPVLEKLLKNEKLDIVDITYPHRMCRSLGHVLAHEILGAMWVAGLSREQLLEVAEIFCSWGLLEEEPKRVVRRIASGKWVSIARRGLCPVALYCELHGMKFDTTCTDKLTLRVSRAVQSKLDLVVAALRRLLGEQQ